MVWWEQGFHSCSKAYGLPLYSAAWGKKEPGDEWNVLLAGGRSNGQRGIPNALLLCKFNTGSFSLSDPPVWQWNGDVPHRIAVLPEENVAFCLFPDSCRWFEISRDSPSADSSSSVMEDAGLQSALACHSDSCGKRLIATGGADGHLRLFSWSNEGSRLIFNETNAHTSVKDLVFSCDGLLLASLGLCGSCRIWSTESENNIRLVANIPNDENFRFCRFSKSRDNNQVLYLMSEQGPGKRIVSRYNFIGQIQNERIVSWQRQSSGKTVLKQTDCEDQISAFDISADGKMLAVGTIEGDIVILRSSSMSLLTVVKKAHSGLVTALAFNDSGGLLSTSVDAKARVTVIKENGRHGFSTFSLFMGLLLLVVALLVKCYIRKDLCSPPSSIISLLNSVCDLGFNLGGQAASTSPRREYTAT